MSSKVLKAVLAITVAASALSLSTANAAENPLHPSFYMNKYAGQSWVPTYLGEGVRYQDRNNPLSPGYGVKIDQPAPLLSAEAVYVDSRNPLHPSYRN